MGSNLQADNTRLVEGFRGLEMETVVSKILETQLQGLLNSGRLISGVSSGLVYGAPRMVNGQPSGRTPGLMPDDFSQATDRTLKLLRLATTGLADPYHTPSFLAGLLKGLYQEVSGYGELIKSLVDGTLLNSLFDLTQAINEKPELAYLMGEQMGASMVKDVLEKADQDDYGEFVFTMGVLLGPFIIDLIGLLLTGGAGPLAKRGIATAARVSADAANLASDFKRLGADRLFEINRLVQNAADALPNGGLTSAAAGGPTFPPGFPGRAAEVPQGAFLSQADDATSTVSQAAKGLESGAGLAPNGTRLNPGAALDVTPGNFSVGQGVAGGIATSAVRNTARSVVHATSTLASKASFGAILRAKRQPQLLDHWSRIIDPSRVPKPTDSKVNLPAGLDLVHRDFIPEIGSLPTFVNSGKKLESAHFGLFTHINRANEFNGHGTITKLDASVVPELTHGVAIGGFEKSRRAVLSQVSAILRPRTFRVSKKLRYNNNPPWPAVREQARGILEEMSHRGSIDSESIIYHMGHLFGPGMGAEAHAGAGLIAAFVNVKLQAGFISNSAFGRLSASDARFSNPELVSEIMKWFRYDQAGAEGAFIDYALTAKEASKKVPGKENRYNQIVGLDTTAESWGDELLETEFFLIAAELGNTKIKPQHFTRAVEYRMSTFEVVPSGNTAALQEVANRWIIRIELHPPPIGKAEVSVRLSEFGEEARHIFDRTTLATPPPP